MAVEMHYPTPLPSTKGWGPGWSSGDESCAAVRPDILAHPIFQGGVHQDISELVDLIAGEAAKRGFTFHQGWSWGFACRGTKSASGPGTGTPSFHSWGLALDINSPENVFGAPESSSEIATKDRWLVGLMADYGFFWLGPAIGDWMHVHFAGTPADAVVMTQKARTELGDGGDEDVNLDQYQAGWDAYVRRFKDKGTDPGAPPNDWSPWKRNGWSAARFSSQNPKPA